MELKFQHHCFTSSSSSNSLFPQKPIRIHLKGVDLEHLQYNWSNWRKRCLTRDMVLENTSHRLSCRVICFRKHCTITPRRSRMKNLIPRASSDDVTVNGTPQASTSTDDVEEMRAKLNQSLQGEDHSDGLVQFLHDAARVFELAIKEQNSISKTPWFSTAWLGVDKNAWVKALSYKASVHSLLQAASEISSRGEGRDRDINVSVQRSLSRQSAPLESVIREELTMKQPEAYEWFWSEQVPMVATTFVNYLERDPRFTAATAVSGKGMGSGSGNAGDISLLMLALTCLSAITKLGPAKISCSQFFSMVPDVMGRLMDMLVDFIPMSQAYHFVKDIGLRREFLVHFGPRAADYRVKNDRGTDEVVFWVDIIQQHLQRAIDRERIWSRLTTCESIEVLERDLAIFGVFIALGRSTQSFLSANGFDTIDSPLEGLIRYLIGGSVLYYPPLSSISSYQFYVEVVCEELDWIPFYPGIDGASKPSHGHDNKQKGPTNPEAIPQVLDACSYWMQSFIKYSKWLDKPANVKAARFLSRGHNKLQECIEELGMSKIETDTMMSVENTGFPTYSPVKKDTDSFDKALESVEEALIRLEELLQELHVSNSCRGKEQLKAACSDLEKIRKLKKEAEFLEASFRAKADSLQQGAEDGDSQTSIDELRPYSKGKNRNVTSVKNIRFDRANSNPRGLWNFLAPRPTRKLGPESSTKNEPFEATISASKGADADSSEIRRFELLRNELMELEIRVQRSADQSENDEDITVPEGALSYSDNAREAQLVQIQKKENIIEKSFDKLKETTTDVWQGTQLLAIDVAASTGLLRRVLIGDDLTEKEKKALQRTLTDLASVVPIGILMLLPVTAVGHAAILAAIQRYVPSLIPSTYGPERLDLLRQLEKVKEMETSEVTPDENPENIPSL